MQRETTDVWCIMTPSPAQQPQREQRIIKINRCFDCPNLRDGINCLKSKQYIIEPTKIPASCRLDRLHTLAPDYEHCGNMSSDGERQCNYRGGTCKFTHTKRCKDYKDCNCELCIENSRHLICPELSPVQTDAGIEWICNKEHIVRTATLAENKRVLEDTIVGLKSNLYFVCWHKGEACPYIHLSCRDCMIQHLESLRTQSTTAGDEQR